MDGADSKGRLTQPSQENDGSYIEAAAATAKDRDKHDAKREDCTICLQPLNERAIAVPCNHLSFDFICLVSWLQQRNTCPLCNSAITEVQYDWVGPNDYKRYRLPESQPPRTRNDENPRFSTLVGPNSNRAAAQHGSRTARNRLRESSNESPPHAEDTALTRRRRVYQEKLYSFHVGSNHISRYRDFTPHEFASSPALQSRARMFLRRELRIFTYFDSAPRMRNREFVLEYIVAVLKSFDPKGADGKAEDFLAEFFQRDIARLLLHELQTWLRSPYATLQVWDGETQYADDEVYLTRPK